MSLDLTKYRKATHDHVAVAGSYTDTFIEAQGASATSASSDAFVRWVPNNKSGSGYYTGTVTTNLASNGYLQYNCTTSGYHVLYFQHFSDSNAYNNSNTSPGIILKTVTTHAANSTGYTNLANQITQFLQYDTYDAGFLVIVNKNRIASNSALNAAMIDARSWRHEVSIGTNSTLKDFSYAACITNIKPLGASNTASSGYDTLGMLSESLAGTGSGHLNGAIELAIEHKTLNIGHAGYGKDMASGFGKGTSYLGMTGSSYQRQVTINEQSGVGYDTVSEHEYVRATFEAKIGQGAEVWGGFVKVQLEEESVGGSTLNTQQIESKYVDVWQKHELLMQKSTQTNSSTPYLNINILPYEGSGTGAGIQYHKVDIKNLEVFKCGNGPDQARDVAVHKWHVNALDIEEGPADFKMGDLVGFKAFRDNTNRNLAGTSASYTTYTDLTGGGSSLRNRQYHNQTSTSLGSQGSFNYPQLGTYKFQSTNSSNTDFWVHEAPSPTNNLTKYWRIGNGGPSTALDGISVDHEKAYLAGVWMRVRRNSPTGEGYAPNRVSLTALGLNSSNQSVVMTTNTSSGVASGNHMLQSIGMNSYPNLDSNRMEWKLLNGFFLPSWMTASERNDWKNNYWGKWAGQFEHGEGSDPNKCMTGITGYGINAATAGYVAGMTSSVTKISPRVLVEQYSSTDLWVEFVYPFIVEIDPANFNDEGQAFFWDIGEA